MECRKCKKEIPENSIYCNLCGAKQVLKQSSKPAKNRGNGQGSAYKDSNGKWTAEATVGWDIENGKLKRISRKKRGFATKREALAYIPELSMQITQVNRSINFKDLYTKWLSIHSQRVSKSTVNCYKSAFKYFVALYYIEMVKIRTEHIQACIDECPQGTRTKENMKALSTCLCRYAMQLDLIDRNYGEYVYISKGEKSEKIAFSKEQLDTMWENVSEVPELKYILILCYTGMRLGEFIKAETKNYNKEEGYFITGSKTEAGKDRIITISPKILPFFSEFGKSEYLFFDKKMQEKAFRSETFYPALEKINLDIKKSDGTHLYTPHCCRHTFATLMKDVEAPPTDKQKLIGHSKFEMTAHYTHTDIDSLKRITDRL